MLPELFAEDALVLRKPQGIMPTEKEAAELFPVKDPWSVWVGGRPKQIVQGKIARQNIRINYIAIIFDVVGKSDDLLMFDDDGQEYPIAITQQARGSMVAHVGVGSLMGIELSPQAGGELKGTIAFEVSRIRRLMDRVISG